MRYVTKKNSLAFTVLVDGGVRTVSFQGGSYPGHGEITNPELIHAIESHRFYGKVFFREGDEVVNRHGMTRNELDAVKEAAREALDSIEPEPSVSVALPSPSEIRSLKKVETVNLMETLGIDHDPTLAIAVLKKQLREWIAENA